MDKGHGRIEIREIWTSVELNGYLDFPHVEQVFCVKRTTTDLHGNLLPGRKGTEEVCYGVTSLAAQEALPERVLALNRGHWEIESAPQAHRETHRRKEAEDELRLCAQAA